MKGQFFCLEKKKNLKTKTKNSNQLRASSPLSSVCCVAQVIKENSPSSYLSATRQPRRSFTVFRIDCRLGVDIGPSFEGAFSVYKRISRSATCDPRHISRQVGPTFNIGSEVHLFSKAIEMLGIHIEFVYA